MSVFLDIRTATHHFPGIGRYVRNLTEALVPQLARGEVLALVGHPDQAAHFAARTGTNVQFVSCGASPFGLPQQWRVPQVLRQQGVARSAALYHSPYYLMPYRPGLPTVLTCYDLIPLHFPAYVSPRARLLFRTTMGLALRTAREVVAISEASRRDLLASFPVAPDRVTTTPLAPAPHFQPQSEAAIGALRGRYGLPADFLLYLGINKPHKNLVTLLHAYARLPGTAAPLVIAGAWDERYPETKTTVQVLGLGERVRFLGPVPEPDLPALYAAALAFVFPSRYEGFGLPVLEAMACGTPVACSNVSSLPEVAGDAALFFDPDDVPAIAQTIQRLLDEKALRADLRGRGLAQAARFTWERTAAATLAVYRKLLHS